jgi:hypothetical protein
MAIIYFPPWFLCPWPHYKPMKKVLLIVVTYVWGLFGSLSTLWQFLCEHIDFWLNIEWISITFFLSVRVPHYIYPVRFWIWGKHWFMVLYLYYDGNWLLKVIWGWDPCCWEFYLFYLCDYGELYCLRTSKSKYGVFWCPRF